MKKSVIVILSYIGIFIFLFSLYSIIPSILSNQSPQQIFANSLIVAPLAFFFNALISLFLLLAIYTILSTIELRKAKDAYNNARNRIGFIKNGQIVCFEGEIQPSDENKPLLSPISRKDCVFYCYGNKSVGGGAQQRRTVIKPSGETIPLNGWLSGEYVEKEEYDPSKTSLNHLYSFMMERKNPKVKTQDVAYAPYFYKITPGNDQRDTFSNHEILDSLNEEMFNKYKYTEIVIPSGIYGWTLGRWDAKNKQLIPLKFASYIYVIQKDYKHDFLKYISKYRTNYLLGAFSLILLAIFLSIPIFTLVIFP